MKCGLLLRLPVAAALMSFFAVAGTTARATEPVATQTPPIVFHGLRSPDYRFDLAPGLKFTGRRSVQIYTDDITFTGRELFDLNGLWKVEGDVALTEEQRLVLGEPMMMISHQGGQFVMDPIFDDTAWECPNVQALFVAQGVTAFEPDSFRVEGIVAGADVLLNKVPGRRSEICPSSEAEVVRSKFNVSDDGRRLTLEYLSGDLIDLSTCEATGSIVDLGYTMELARVDETYVRATLALPCDMWPSPGDVGDRVLSVPELPTPTTPLPSWTIDPED